MAQYHLSKNGQESGPFSEEQFNQMLKSGLFTGAELFRTDETPEWKPVSQKSGFVPPAAPLYSTPPPVPATPPSSKSTCMIVAIVVGIAGVVFIAIIALLAAIAVPNFLRARKRSQATRELQELRLIDAATDQCAIERNLKPGTVLQWKDLTPFLPPANRLTNSGGKDMLGNSYGPTFTVDELPKIPSATFNALSDVAPASFWSPYK